MRRRAYVCDTPYQIFNCLNIAYHERDCVSDLFLVVRPAILPGLVENITKSGLFRRVYRFVDEQKGAHEWGVVWDFKRMDAYLEPRKTLRRTIREEYGPDSLRYDEIYSAVFSTLAVCLKKVNPQATFCLFEDGTGSYSGNLIDHTTNWKHKLFGKVFRSGSSSVKVERLYVNSPRLCESVAAEKIEGLPKFTEEFLSFVSGVFSVSLENLTRYRKPLIFLTQPNELNFPLRITREVVEVMEAFQEDTLVRAHPRDNDADLYSAFEVMARNGPMWELLAAVSDMDDLTLIGTYSTAQITPKLLFDKEPSVIFLYNLYAQMAEKSMLSDWRKMTERLRVIYSHPEKIHSPKTLREFERILCSGYHRGGHAGNGDSINNKGDERLATLFGGFMNIILFYEHLSREWRATSRLLQLLNGGGRVIRRFSIIFELSKAYRYARRHPVDVVVTPWLTDDEHERILSPILDASPYVTVVNLHHEQISNKAFQPTLYPRTPFAKNGAFHCAWGAFFQEALLQQGVKDDRIFITGNIRNDEAFSVAVSRERLAKEFGLNSEKTWVLFAENRGWLLQRDSDAVFRILCGRGLQKSHIEESIRYTKESLDKFFRELRGLSAAFGSEFEFIYRPHPGTNLTYPADLPDCVHAIGAYTIYDWIQQCGLFLTCESTSIFEADMCGKPAALFDLAEEPEYLKMEGVHDYPRLNRLSDISADYIRRLQEMKRERIYLRYVGAADGGAAQRVADAIQMATEIRLPPYPYDRRTRKELLRQFLWESATACMDKTGLLDTLRYPHSAYAERADIPYSKRNRWIQAQ